MSNEDVVIFESIVEEGEGFWVKGMVPRVAILEDDDGNAAEIVYISIEVYNRATNKNELLDFFVPFHVWNEFILKTID